MGAGEQVNDYGVGDVNASSIMETLDTQRLGYHALTLTEFDTTTRPAVAAGSKIEINGAIFKFATESVISGTPADGIVYILLTVVGTSVTASFTAVAPTWSDSKQGWYDGGNNRYANFIMTQADPLYSDKRTYLPDQEAKIDNILVSTFDADAFATQDLSANGYAKIGPLYLQWGKVASPGASGTVTFPIEFPTAALSFSTSGANGTVFGETGGQPVLSTDLTNTDFDWSFPNTSGGRGDFWWIAIGY